MSGLSTVNLHKDAVTAAANDRPCAYRTFTCCESKSIALRRSSGESR